MFEYIVEPEQKKKRLSDSAGADLAAKIAKNYDTFNKARQSSVDKAFALQKEIFFNSECKSDDPDEKWKSHAKMCKTFMFYQTLKAFIWRNTYANVNSMFDVSGENRNADNNSNKQKAMLVDIFEKMEYQKTCDKVIDYALLYGELITFTAWKKQYQEYRRPIDFFKNLFSKDINKLPLILDAIKNGKNFWVEERKIYDNPYVYPVSPADLVFDTTQADNWDSCPKIYRVYKTPTDIINNKFYNISKEIAEEIISMVNNSDSSKMYALNREKGFDSDIVNGSTIEVLEHWGDLKLSDGTLLKNWHAVIVGRKHLVAFEKNERIINPFSYGAFILDPKVKRGISPLYCVLSLAHLQEDLFNRTCNLQALTENPPLLAPEGFFEKGEIELYPGKIIEYGDNLTPSAAFQQLNFNPSIFLQDISFLNDLMAEVSGIFPNMIGAVEYTAAKTATEINTKSQGQMTRLSMLVDTINQDFTPKCQKSCKALCRF